MGKNTASATATVAADPVVEITTTPAAATEATPKAPSAATLAKQAKEAGLNTLREILPSGSRVFTTIRHVAPSGKTTSVFPFSVGSDLDLVDLKPVNIAEVIGYTPDNKNGGIRVQGNTDPAGRLVSEMGLALYGNAAAFNHRPV